MKKFKIFVGIVVAAIVMSSCTQSLCPTYTKAPDGSHLDKNKCIDYTYTARS